ncbi:MAG TPA: 16S rRNA (adenine(1518)-N(6)/adenine(1519)-N(6))-dimethyltransferase RsmA [Polyangiaceae bacterium]
MNERGPKAELVSRGLRAKRQFGQNFLADENLCRRIAELVPEGASVVELGAGLGALTAPLLERTQHLVAVERDRDLIPILRERFATDLGAGRLRVEEADAKAIDVKALLEGFPQPHVLAGNLPYQISGPLLKMAISLAAELERVVFLLQLEVAERLAAVAGSEHYGALSVFTQAAYGVSRAFVIRRGAFYPQPSVDSAVVVLTPRAGRVEETPRFRALVRQAFQSRRKKLRNAWDGLGDLAPAAARAGIDLDARGETLGVAAFARMEQELSR